MNAALPIGQLLLDARLIGADQLRIALHEQQQRKRPLGQVLVELGFISDTALRDALAAHCGHPSVDLASTLADPAALSLVPQALARRHRLLPLEYRAAERTLVVAIADTDNVIALDRLHAELGPGTRLELLVAADSAEPARALKPIDERTLPFGKTVLLFDGVPREQLTALGETRVPGIADLFVAIMKGTYA